MVRIIKTIWEQNWLRQAFGQAAADRATAFHAV